MVRRRSPQVLDFRLLRKWTINSGRFPHPRPLPEGQGRGEGFRGQGRSIMIHDNSGEKQMHDRTRMRSSSFRSDNRKSKTCPEICRRIENLKWLGLSVICFVLGGGGG